MRNFDAGTNKLAWHTHAVPCAAHARAGALVVCQNEFCTNENSCEKEHEHFKCARRQLCTGGAVIFSSHCTSCTCGALFLLLYVCNLIIFDLCALSKRQYEKKNTYTVFEVTRLRSMNCATWINPHCRCYIWCSEFGENCSSIYTVREYYVRRKINES